MEDLTPSESAALLVRGKVAHLGVIDEDEPYVTPLSYVVMDDSIFFRTAPGRRLKALEADPAVCIEVSRFDADSGDWDSVIAFGRAEIVRDPRTREDVVAALLAKYRDQMGSPLAFSWAQALEGEQATTVRVHIERLTGRASGRGLGHRTRPGRL